MSMIPLELIRVRYYVRNGRSAILTQFSVILIYAITDFKCQEQISLNDMLCDIKKSSDGFSLNSSFYVQLSHMKSLNRLSIMRPFESSELQIALSIDLLKELECKENMAMQMTWLYKA